MKYPQPTDSLIKKDRYQVFLIASPANFPFVFATHPWFVINQKGKISRFGIASSNRVRAPNIFGTIENQGHWEHLYKNFLPPWQGIRIFFFSWKFLWKGRLLASIEGDEGSVAQKMADFIEHSPEKYPYKDYYSLLGPNSNTYVQWVLNHFPQISMRLPWNAFGKGVKAIKI